MATLINHGDKRAFIHIPKCAGTTISATLVKSDPKKWIPAGKLPGVEAAIRKNGATPGSDHIYPDHARFRDVEAVLGQERFAGFEVFTAVRCPWERLESTYHFIRRLTGSMLSDLMRTMTFNDFILYHCTVAKALQTDWLISQSGQITVAHVFQNHEIDTKVDAFMQAQFNVSLGGAHANASDNAFGEKFETYKWASDEAVEMFADAYAADFTNFGYDSTPPMRGKTWFMGRAAVQDISPISVKNLDRLNARVDSASPEFSRYMFHFATLSGENLRRILMDKQRQKQADLIKKAEAKIAKLEAELATLQAMSPAKPAS